MQSVGPDVEDEDLVTRCQAGDIRAFDELVQRYRGRVYAMIFNMVHNEQDAWDLAQDGFFKAWKSIGKFRGQSSFYTWLYRIVMNLAIDWSRKRQIQSGIEFNDEVGLDNIEPGSSTSPKAEPLPHARLEQAEIGRRIELALSKLSSEHRAVILLKEQEGLQYHEIAEVLHCSIGTVMSRLFYARKKLQGMLKDLHENV